MHQSQGIPIWFAMAFETIQAHLADLGAKSWTRFVEAAKVSHIPAEFLSASVKKGGDFEQISMRIFKTRFRNPEECAYGVSYATAISALKIFLDLEMQIAENQRMLETMRQNEIEIGALMQEYAARLGCSIVQLPDRLVDLGFISGSEALKVKQFSNILPQIEDASRSITRLNEALAKVRKIAESSCGAVVQLESYCTPPSLRSFRQWVFWWIRRLMGKKATLRDLGRVRGEVENYFNSEKNRARIILASI